MHIFLTGFMCSGKTRVGRELAGLLGLPWHDIDRVAEKRVGPLLPFVQHEGEEAFRIVEEAVLQELIALPDAVISCGGGTPLRTANRERMRSAGTVVFLDVSLPVLLERIRRAGGDRPLLFGLKGDDLNERVEALLDERLPLYRQADLEMPADAEWTEVAARVARTLQGQSR